jgi:hypothetical protein
MFPTSGATLIFFQVGVANFATERGARKFAHKLTFEQYKNFCSAQGNSI